MPEAASGRLRRVAVPVQPPDGPGRLVHFTVEVEEGLPVDPAHVAATVQTALLDRRGWQRTAHVTFMPARGSQVDIRITLASPRLVDRLCAPLRTRGEVSCWNHGRAILNAKRWLLGAPTYGNDIAGYQTYLVGHEVGHGLGYRHASCPASGRLAPVMVQQTKSLDGCRRNPWPAATAG